MKRHPKTITYNDSSKLYVIPRYLEIQWEILKQLRQLSVYNIIFYGTLNSDLELHHMPWSISF